MASRPKAKLSYPEEMYNPAILNSGIIEEKALRAEYMKLRNVANKRLTRMGDSEFNKSQAYRSNVGKYNKTSTDLTLRQLTYALTDVAQFVNRETSSIRGQQKIRRETVATLQFNGYKGVNKDNFLQFVEFMEDWRAREIDKVYTSEQVAELYEIAEKKKIKPKELEKHFSEYMDKKEDLSKMKTMKTKSGKPKGAAYYRKELGIK